MVTNLHPNADGQASKPSQELRTLVDDLIAEQAILQTPVARFAETHDRLPDLTAHYRNLIPLSKPAAGEQYAFEVSLDRCTGCKACVSACHSLNGLDDDEVWRDVGTVISPDVPGWQQTVTTACHHCESPECLHGCPVGAYEKNPDTGIVHHLDDQCIGCSYCILKCPYDVPKYNPKRGIVRKCDMCHQRLEVGEAPACVQACPTEAIRIIKVKTGQSRTADLTSNGMIDSASAELTLPTTRYVGRDIPSMIAPADRHSLQPQHAHWPLILMLAPTQVGIGLIFAAITLGIFSVQSEPEASIFTPTILLLGIGTLIFNGGMGAATLHLGQPLKAWRFFIGLRTSWLSREILAFSLFAPLPVLLIALHFTPDFRFKMEVSLFVSLSTIGLGLVAIFTSVMIYHDTSRQFWRLHRSSLRFFGTAFTYTFLGLATIYPQFALGSFLIILGKALAEFRFLRWANDPAAPWTPDAHSARLMLGPLRVVLIWRFVLAIAGALIVLVNPWLALPLLMASEILERQLFFQAVQAPKMPGNFGS